MTNRCRTTPNPVLFCEVLHDIPALDLLAGDRIIIENLGEPGGVVLRRPIDTVTAQAVLTQSAEVVSVVSVPRRRFDRRLPLPAVLSLHREA